MPVNSFQEIEEKAVHVLGFESPFDVLLDVENEQFLAVHVTIVNVECPDILHWLGKVLRFDVCNKTVKQNPQQISGCQLTWNPLGLSELESLRDHVDCVVKTISRNVVDVAVKPLHVQLFFHKAIVVPLVEHVCNIKMSLIAKLAQEK